MKRSLPYITNLKFFAVILVLLGHSVQYTYTNNFDNVLLFNSIYAFHMPLFIFLSGFLVNFSRKENFISNRLRSLFVPFIAWAIFYCIYYYQKSNLPILPYTVHFFVELIKSPDNGGLWFLWILLICSLIYYSFSTKKNKYLYYFVILLMLNAIYIIPKSHILGLGLLRWYFLFFTIGVFIGDKYIYDKKYEYAILIISFLLAIFFVYNFKRNGIITNLHGKDLAKQILYNLLAAVSSIIFLFTLFKQIFSVTSAKIKWIADQSLGFYAVQFIFFTYSKPLLLNITDNLITITILSFFTSFSGSILLIISIRKIYFLKKILLGQH